MCNYSLPDKAHRCIPLSQHHLPTCFLSEEKVWELLLFCILLHFVSQSMFKSDGPEQLREQCLFVVTMVLSAIATTSLGMRIWEFSREFVRISWEFRYMKIWKKVWRVNFAPPTWELALYCQTRMLFYYEKDRFLPESSFNTPRQINLLPSVLP